jgi:hypothetical protein
MARLAAAAALGDGRMGLPGRPGSSASTTSRGYVRLEVKRRQLRGHRATPAEAMQKEDFVAPRKRRHIIAKAKAEPVGAK